MHEDEVFRPLAQTLRVRTVTPETVPAEESTPQAQPCAEAIDAVRTAVRFHACVREALDAAVETLMFDIAASVLGRELELRPCDLRAIVSRAVARFGEAEPLRVRMHPADVRDDLGLPAVPDAQLMPGDVWIELRGGCIDARLGARLQCVLDANVR